MESGDHLESEIERLDKLHEKNLWERIFELAKSASPNFFKVQWMPSHLNEPEKAAQKKRAIENNLVPPDGRY